MNTIEVGLADSPMLIAHRYTGDPRRYTELLHTNPHKSIVHVGGRPTFASLGVGEWLSLPPSWGLGAGGSTLLSPGHTLQVGQTIQSPNGRAQLVLQTDGNLVLYDGTGHKALWSSGTNGKPSHHAIMQTDGNFVVYDAQNRPLWASGTNGKPGAYLAIQDDGNLVVYSGSSTPWSSNTYGFTQHQQSGGFDLGTAIGQAWHAVQQGVGSVVDVANALHIPGINLATAIITGKNPIDALKADIASFAAAASVAQHVVSGNMAGLSQDLAASAAKFGVTLPAGAVQAAVAAAQSGKSPTDIATAALGSNYTDAWNVATNGGNILSDLPAPPNASYQAGAATTAANPITTVKKIPLHLALKAKPVAVPVDQAAVAQAAATSAATPAPAGMTVGAYPPYPARHA
jgi:hypothetical protein